MNKASHLPAHDKRTADLRRRVLSGEYGNSSALKAHANTPVYRHS
jgi:hypothetical protein